MYSSNAKIVKPSGEKVDEFESSISQVMRSNDYSLLTFDHRLCSTSR